MNKILPLQANMLQVKANKVRILLVFTLIVCSCLRLNAQEEVVADSVAVAVLPDNTHAFTPKKLIVPAAFIAVGTFAQSNNWVKKQTKWLQNNLQNDNHDAIKIDDYAQYAPIVSTYALNVFGVKGKHNYKDLTIISAMAYVSEFALVQGTKRIIHAERPDGGNNSFPSGHSATVFTGATILWEEYKDVSPWIGVAGYAVAVGTGFLRMYNNKHYLQDVIAGAGIGILSAKLAYWLYPVIFHHNVSDKKTYSARVFGAPFVGNGGAGCTAFITF